MADRPTSPFTPDGLRDPHLDVLWRAGSSEEPPPAIDAALLALARREAGAKPHDVRVAEATRPERWWWPLAAAAVIGVVVVGMLPILSTETADPFAETKPLDRDAAGQRAARNSTPEASARHAAAAVSVAGSEPTTALQSGAPKAVESNTALQADALKAKKAELADAAKPAQADKPAQTELVRQALPAPAAKPDKQALAPQRKTAPESLDRNAAAVKDDGFRAPASATSAAADALEEKRKDEAPRERGTATAVPFPASPAPMPAAPSSVAQSASPPGGVTMQQAPSVAGGVTMPQSPSATGGVATPAPAAAAQMRKELPTNEVEPSPSMRAAAMPAGSADDKRQALAAKTRQRDQESGRALEADVDPAVAEWIARIRRLRDEGKPEEAKKEWVALREKHPDAERALPPELREWLTGKR